MVGRVDAGRSVQLRAQMVERQLRGRGIRDETVLAAMAALPRENFVPPDQLARSYSDDALPIASGQTISQPYMVAWMTELLEPQPGMRVLEVGTGSGYQTAVLAQLGCSVVSVERHAELAGAARSRLDELGLSGHVKIVVGDGSIGRPEDAPFDAIVVTAAAPAIPAALPGQLADGGRLVVPVGARRLQELLLIVRRGDAFETRDCGGCVFVPLVGESGFSEEAGRRHRWLGRLLV
jgi:protein-L-isoaspartate(D-aspartate) O-methyltransferase